MFSGNRKERESVEKDIFALLAAEKEAIPVSRLNHYYADQEGSNIPWKEFGYVSLLDFLQNMSKDVTIRHINGISYIQGVISDKSKHITSLVSRQKQTVAKKIGGRIFKPNMYFPKVTVPKAHIPADVMASIISLLKESTTGLNKDYVLLKIQNRLRFSNITMTDLDDRLRELSHEIYIKDNIIYWKKGLMTEENVANGLENGNVCSNDFSDFAKNEQPRTGETASNYCISGEDEDYFDAHTDYNIGNAVQNFQSQEKSRTSQLTCNVIKESANFQTEHQQNEQKYPPIMEEKYSKVHTIPTSNMNTNLELLDEVEFEQTEDIGILINDRLKFRLEKLIEKYPNGIWCSELPTKYAEEYNISLNYAELGFNSIIHFASHLPEIFTCINEANPLGDFKLYGTKALFHGNEKRKVGERQWKQNLAQLYTIRADWMDDTEAVPPAISAECSKKLIPDNVMNIGESVGHICVSDLHHPEIPFIEVYVVEVFTPSFFWIRLRKSRETFKKFMADLNTFYNDENEKYAMPAVVLESGMNCACLYDKIWHRGIVKSVTPDLRVTIMFYDYGTLKTYNAQDVYYLHRRFSNLPAQAVPCGLYNVKPREGKEWRKGVTYQFALRTDKIPFAATIESINEEDNSMMITLTDTRQEEDVHINDWLIEQNLATHGKLVDDVDMINLLRYTEENLIMKPEDMLENDAQSNPLKNEEPQKDKPLITPQSMLNVSTSEYYKSSGNFTLPENSLNESLHEGPSIANTDAQFNREISFPMANETTTKTAQEMFRLWKENYQLKMQMQVTNAVLKMVMNPTKLRVDANQSITSDLNVSTFLADLMGKLSLDDQSTQVELNSNFSSTGAQAYPQFSSSMIDGLSGDILSSTQALNQNSQRSNVPSVPPGFAPINEDDKRIRSANINAIFGPQSQEKFHVLNPFVQPWTNNESLLNLTPTNSNPFKISINNNLNDTSANPLNIFNSLPSTNFAPANDEYAGIKKNVLSPSISTLTDDRVKCNNLASKFRETNGNSKFNDSWKKNFKPLANVSEQGVPANNFSESFDARKDTRDGRFSTSRDFLDNVSKKDQSFHAESSDMSNSFLDFKEECSAQISQWFNQTNPFTNYCVTKVNEDLDFDMNFVQKSVDEKHNAALTDMESSLIYENVALSNTVVYLFRYKRISWVSADEFVETFTHLKTLGKFFTWLELMNINIPLVRIKRFQYPDVFSQLDSTSLKAPRDESHSVESILLMPLKYGINILLRLQTVLPEDVKSVTKIEPLLPMSLIRNMWTLLKTHERVQSKMQISGKKNL